MTRKWQPIVARLHTKNRYLALLLLTASSLVTNLASSDESVSLKSSYSGISCLNSYESAFLSLALLFRERVDWSNEIFEAVSIDEVFVSESFTYLTLLSVFSGV